MSDDAVTVYHPRKRGSRNAWYDLISYFYDYESYYPPKLQNLWQSIVKARPTFPEKLKPLGTFWETDKSKAFKDLSKGGWFGFWSERLVPLDTISRDAFYVSDKDDMHLSNIQWVALHECAEMVGDYVLMREKGVKAEQQNHPINFFYADVMRVCEILSEETSPHEARKHVMALNTYIRNVGDIVESQSHDGFFIGNLLRFLTGKVHRELDAGIEHASLKGDFERLKKNVGGLERKARRIMHLGGDKPVPEHPPFVTQKASRQANPTKAMIDCAQDVLSTPDSTAVAKRESAYKLTPNALMIKEGDELKPNTALFALCDGAPIATTADKTRQENYLTGLSHLEKLGYHTQLINGILTLFNDAGHINMVLQFSGQLADYLSVLREDLSQAKTDLNQYLEGNRARSQDLFLKGERGTWFGDKLTKEETAFLANQKALEQLQYTTVGLPGIEQVLEDIHGVTHRLTDLFRKYQKTHIQKEKIGLVKDIEEAIKVLKIGSDIRPSKVTFDEDVSSAEKSHSAVKPSIPKQIETVTPEPSTIAPTNTTSLVMPTEPIQAADEVIPIKIDMPTETKVDTEGDVPEKSDAALDIVALKENGHVVATYQDTKEEEGIRLNHCFLEIKQETGERRLVCAEAYARTTIIPKLIDGKIPNGWETADTYQCDRLSHLFEGRPSLYCDGQNTIAYVQYTPPPQALLAERAFNEVGNQIALTAVFYQMAKSFYQWWTSTPQEIILAGKDEAESIFLSIKTQLDDIETLYSAYNEELLWIITQIKQHAPLADIKKGISHKTWWLDGMFRDEETFFKAVSERSSDMKWLNTIIEDHKKDLASYRKALEEDELSREDILETKNEVDYLLSYVTPIYIRETLESKVDELLDLLQKKIKLVTRSDFDCLESYFKVLSGQRANSHVVIAADLGKKYLEIMCQTGFSQAMLLEVAEMSFMINNILNEDKPLRQSDILDVEDELNDLLKQLDSFQCEKKDYVTDLLADEKRDLSCVLREGMRLLRKKHYNVWYPELIPPLTSQFFVPPKQKIPNAIQDTLLGSKGDKSHFTFNWS